jgi:tyrosine-specific transport protein
MQNPNKNRFLGAVLLVAGTAIGAGMLALPLSTAIGGFCPSLLLFILSWGFLFATAWVLLDVTLSFPEEVNLMTMASKTLGTVGRIVCWLAYLLLLYSLTAAYIAGSSPLFVQGIHYLTGKTLPSWAGPLPLLAIFGFFVYLGTSSVDKVNRILVGALFAAYLVLVFYLPPRVQPELLTRSHFSAIWSAVPIVITSFGFHIIIPTLTPYLHRNVKSLRLVLLIGSLIPLIVYAIWEFLILGTVPLEGEYGLLSTMAAGKTSAEPLSHLLSSPWVGTMSSLFAFFAILTSFLGVSLSLADFLTDGLKMKRFSMGREFVSLLTFLPPLLFVYT